MGGPVIALPESFAEVAPAVLVQAGDVSGSQGMAGVEAVEEGGKHPGVAAGIDPAREMAQGPMGGDNEATEPGNGPAESPPGEPGETLGSIDDEAVGGGDVVQGSPAVGSWAGMLVGDQPAMAGESGGGESGDEGLDQGGLAAAVGADDLAAVVAGGKIGEETIPIGAAPRGVEGEGAGDAVLRVGIVPGDHAAGW